MNKKLLYISIILSFCSCKDEAVKEQSVSTDLMSKDELIPLIIDLQILESHYHRVYQRPDAYKNALDSASYFVFENHNTSREEFEMSFTHYSQNVDEMYEIYEVALDSVNLRISTPQDQIEQQ